MSADVQSAENEAPECKAVRPGTLGYQRCWRDPGHTGPHKSQDRQEWDEKNPLGTSTQKSRTSPEASAPAADGPCQTCGRSYPAWFAPHEVWNLVMGGPDATDDPGGLLCPTCFLIRADAVIQVPVWRVIPPDASAS